MSHSTIIILILCLSLERSRTFELVTREEWGAKPPKMTEPMTNPVPYVIIHHSYIPAACTTRSECIEAMQLMQDFHQNNRSWNDIGYTFAVGGDGAAYVGRSWDKVGAHAPGYNDRSVGICIIGDWTQTLPPAEQLQTALDLIEFGIQQGHILANYSLMGHKQVREGTECPGDSLYQEIVKWDHYVPSPDDF